MTVRLLVEYRRGADVRLPGGLVELPDVEATRLIEQGHAVPITDEQGIETR